jgi:hypothetical protein
MLSQESKEFIEGKKKWSKWNFIWSCSILVVGMGFLIRSLIHGLKFEIAIYGFVCGIAFGCLANVFATMRWLRITDEAK